MTKKLNDIIDQKRIVINFERAINDLRKGLPILYNKSNLVFASEAIEQTILDSIHQYKKRIIIDKQRAIKIGLDVNKHIGIKIDILGLKDLQMIVLDRNFHASIEDFDKDADYDNILKIMRLAKLVPSAVLIKDFPFNINLLNIHEPDIKQYVELKDDDFDEVCSAPLNLNKLTSSKIKAFRPNIGGQEHYAVIVGDISKTPNPLVRIHSSCFPGDLLASLSCDCREQLRESLLFMQNSPEKAGILVYLMQEGRGIGLTSTIRTFSFQDQLDTVDANLALGFTDDERDYKAGAQILNQLGARNIKLLSNNKRKAESLEKHGIKVIDLVPLITETARNSEYFKTKINKLGHKA